MPLTEFSEVYALIGGVLLALGVALGVTALIRVLTEGPGDPDDAE